MSRNGLGPLVRVDGSFTSDAYVDIIESVLTPYVLDGPFPDGFYLFQQDRSPVHTSRKVSAILDARGVRQLPWPPKGADMSPIENVWGLLKAHLMRSHIGNANADTLWEAIRGEWERLRADTDVVRSLYESMPRRLASVIAADGGFTKY